MEIGLGVNTALRHQVPDDRRPWASLLPQPELGRVLQGTGGAMPHPGASGQARPSSFS